MTMTKKKKYVVMIAGIATLIACAVICLAIYFAHAQSISTDDAASENNSEDPSISFADTGMLMQYTSSGWYAHEIGSSGQTVININVDGTAEIMSIPEILWEDKVVPYVQFTIEKSDMAKLKNAIKATRFMTLEEDLTDWGTCDGGSYFITVYTTTQTHTSGGLNPVNVQFILVKDAMWDAIPADMWSKFYDEQTAYYYDEESEYGY